MHTAALREFLGDLAGALNKLGVPSNGLHDLRDAAAALGPFGEMPLPQLTDFLRRAEEYHRTGAVPADPEPAGFGAVRQAARELSAAVAEVRAGAGDAARVAAAKKAMTDGLTALGPEFGITVAVKDDKKWLDKVREEAAAAGLVRRLRELARRVTGPDSWQDPAVGAEVDQLAAEGDKPLKAAAQAVGAAATGKGAGLVRAVLAHLAGVPAPTGRASTARRAGPDEAAARAMTDDLKRLAEKAKDPAAVDKAEVEAAVARLEAAGFSATQLKAIAEAVSGEKKAKTGELAVLAVRRALMGARRLLDSQAV